jgi:hypothetical protein
MAKKLFGYVEELTENPLDKLEDELDGFENVRYRMDAEGLHYCFKHYSSFKEIKDQKFHEIRENYIKVANEIEEYVKLKISELTDQISNYQDENE